MNWKPLDCYTTCAFSASKGPGSEYSQKPNLSRLPNPINELANAESLRYIRLLSVQFDPQRSHDLEDGREARIAFAG